MLLLSFFFSKSLVLPIKELSKLTVIEREKVSSKKFVKYPIRKDEIVINEHLNYLKEGDNYDIYKLITKSILTNN